MLAEKLLLNLLITLSPVLVYSALLENKKKFSSPYFTGIIHSISSIICMAFSYSNYGFHWDLRYVPLILATLYGGPISGGMVLITIISMRIIVGGETVYYGVVICLLTAAMPFLFTKKFWSFTPNKRVLLGVLIGLWSILLCYLSLITYHYMNGNALKIYIDIPDLLFVGIIYMLAIALASKLIEGIIERSRMKREIQRAEKLNTLGELAASIAHEIRNPLTVVKGFLQLMQQEEQGKKFEYLSLVLSELGRAESIINDYLNFAKPKFEKLEDIPLVEVLLEVVLLLQPFAMKQGVQLEGELGNSPFLIKTDRNQLKQALVNLVKNAIEATPGGGKVSIQFKCGNHQGMVLITDTGKGMTHEQLSRIGTLFYTTKNKGTGLGTSVSLRIIETMKGKVSYKSKLGEGTVVTMVLPESKQEVVNI